MVTIKHTRESIAELEKQREQYKKQRDSLIKDVEKLREELRMHIQCNNELERVNVFKTKKLNREKINNVDKSNVIFKLQEEINKLRKDNDKYTHLTEHIKNKALHNPSVSRYIDLVHVIDELEKEWVIMAYEYEDELLNYASDSETYEKYEDMLNEIKSVYAKAKYFDEILDIDLAQHDEEYADNVMKIVNKYTEDK